MKGEKMRLTFGVIYPLTENLVKTGLSQRVKLQQTARPKVRCQIGSERAAGF